MLTAKRAGLSGTALKTIALVLMVLDHIHYFFEFTGLVPEWFSMLARLSAPLFLFCTVEGFAHTHDRKRYFLRIWAIATAMGTVEFFMMYAGVLRRGDGFYPLNAIMQNFVILCIIWQGIDWLRQRRFVTGRAGCCRAVLWPFCSSRYCQLFPRFRTHRLALPCLAWVDHRAAADVEHHHRWRLVVPSGGHSAVCAVSSQAAAPCGLGRCNLFAGIWFASILQLRGTPDFMFSQMFTTYYEWFGVFAVVLTALYNGQRGSGHKLLFYWFYPAHIYLLYAASCLVYTLTQ